jgi:orotate phosphoribosyltransferase
MSMEKEVARALVEIGAVRFTPDAPITFKSGIISPVYVDNRKLPFYPKEWKVVLSAIEKKIKENKIHFDIVAGVESGGIPHSAALGFMLDMPSVFVRKQLKDHGTKSRIEGGEVRGQAVLLIEDMVSTGASSLAAVEALRDEFAVVTDCIAIVSYNFPDALEAFEKANATLHSLTTFPVILEEAVALGKISEPDAERVRAWFADPYNWVAKV